MGKQNDFAQFFKGAQPSKSQDGKQSAMKNYKNNVQRPRSMNASRKSQ